MHLLTFPLALFSSCPPARLGDLHQLVPIGHYCIHFVSMSSTVLRYTLIYYESILSVQLFARASPALFETSALRRHFDPRVAMATAAVVEQLAQVSESAAGPQRHSTAPPFRSNAHAAANIASNTSIHLFAYLSALASQAYQ